ncbi:MATE family efflux transporter [Intestinibacillus sp. Marseille-P6563]|uniref:MATE family efflux transporter n=1 Tax=Intestinibacillus sp. Marseille-P6563 TaxID=2364792 RepID=UPI000F0713D3|nr:MATE family efflux transporter [Intestinibacillus sp. Marseille-P6563]
MESGQNTHKLGSQPVGRLLLTMGAPMIVSMVLQAFYNIVDSAFVSNMPEAGEAALNALTLAFPLQMLMVAVSIGTGVGAGALLSTSLGQGDREKVNHTAGNALFLGCVIYAIFLIFGLFGVHSYIASQTVNRQIAGMATDYLQICCVISFGIVFFSVFEKLLQATGRSMYSTIAQVAGALVNIVLDPIMIYGYLGCPAFGVRGAAYATVLGQCVSFVLALMFHVRYNREVQNKLVYLKPQFKIIGEIYAIGLPAIVAQALMSVMTYGLNIILVSISESMVTAYGLYYKIQQFILFAAFGLRDAITPTIAFSYGMGHPARIQDGIRYGMLYTLAIMLIGLVILECFAAPFAALFGLSGQTQDLCVSAMHVVSTSFLFAGANIAFQGIFQALGGGIQSLVISFCRQLIFVLPVAWFFAQIGGQSIEQAWLVWLTFPLAEGLSAALACVLMQRLYQKRVLPLQVKKQSS